MIGQTMLSICGKQDNVRMALLSAARFISVGEYPSIPVLRAEFLHLGSNVVHSNRQVGIMTGEELAILPVGAVVKLDGEEGEIVSAGQTVQIMWPESKVTNIIDTSSKKWQAFIDWLEVE